MWASGAALIRVEQGLLWVRAACSADKFGPSGATLLIVRAPSLCMYRLARDEQGSPRAGRRRRRRSGRRRQEIMTLRKQSGASWGSATWNWNTKKSPLRGRGNFPDRGQSGQRHSRKKKKRTKKGPADCRQENSAVFSYPLS